MERKKIISHSSLKEFENDGDTLDRYYLPARSLIIPGEIYLLPDNYQLKQYLLQLNEILQQLNQMQRNPVWIPDTNYLLDIAISQYLLDLAKHLNPSDAYQVFSYATTSKTMTWINELKSYKFNIESAFPQKVYFEDLHHPSHRGGWGRWVNEPDKPSFPEKYQLPYPVSWIGQGLDEIIEAYQRVVDKTENTDAFFKPIFSAGGFNLRIISSVEELIFHYHQLHQCGALDFDGQEIPVEIQAFVPDILGLYSFQYIQSGELVTPQGFSRQIVEHNKWQGNIFNEENPDEGILTIWRNFSHGYKQFNNENFGWGGVDLAKTPSGWMILEHNGLRITGAHPAISLANQFGTIKNSFTTLKAPGEVNCDLKTLWNFLSSNNLAFNPNTKQGIFPIVWFPGSGMLWATGENPKQMLDKAYNQLTKQGYVASYFN
jgi:hypothetical protein